MVDIVCYVDFRTNSVILMVFGLIEKGDSLLKEIIWVQQKSDWSSGKLVNLLE